MDLLLYNFVYAVTDTMTNSFTMNVDLCNCHWQDFCCNHIISISNNLFSQSNPMIWFILIPRLISEITRTIYDLFTMTAGLFIHHWLDFFYYYYFWNHLIHCYDFHPRDLTHQKPFNLIIDEKYDNRWDTRVSSIHDTFSVP